MERTVIDLKDVVSAALDAAKLNQTEAAKRAKVTPQAVSDIMNGRYGVGTPRLNKMLMAAGFTNSEIEITYVNDKPVINIQITQ